MSARFLAVGWTILGLAACATELPVAPEPGKSPEVPVQLGPPPAGNNADPTVMITTPTDGSTVPVGTVQLSADFSDPDVGDTHTCYIDWQLAAGPVTVTESGGAGTCTGSNVYSVPGTYQVIVSIIDQMGGTGADSIAITVATVAAPPPPPGPPPLNGGSVRGMGRLPLGGGQVNGFGGREAAVWFDVHARVSKETGNIKGHASVRIPKAHFALVSTSLTKLVVNGTRADVSGTGKLNGRRRVSFIMCAVDEQQGDRSTGTDRIRIKVWDEAGTVLFDTNPGAPPNSDPTAVPRPGRIIVKP
jgi:hypothetical protein